MAPPGIRRREELLTEPETDRERGGELEIRGEEGEVSGRERKERVWRWRGGRKGGGGGKRPEVNRLYISQTPFQIYIFRHLPEERKQFNVLKERCFFNGINF